MKKYTKLFNTKAASIDEDAKTVSFVISDNQTDRMGEVVDQDTWNLKEYEANPILLWGHDPSEPENVLGQALKVEPNKPEKGKTLGTFHFDTDINAKAALIFDQIKRGTLRCVSVGFMNHTFEMDSDTPVLKDNDLLEVSVVPIPANPRAIALEMKAGLISKKDGNWLMDSMKKEVAYIEEHIEQDKKEDTPAMDETVSKQLSALLDAVTTLTKAQGATDARFNTLIEKGAVADILAAGDPWLLEDAKWEKMAPVASMYYALCEAYSYTGTPVDEFDTLLKEFIGLVSQVLDGSYTGKADGRLAEAVAHIDSARVKAMYSKDATAIATKDADAPADPENPAQPEAQADPAPAESEAPAEPAPSEPAAPAQPEAPADPAAPPGAPATEPAPAADPAPEAPAEEPAAPAPTEDPTPTDEPTKGDEATQPDNSANGGDNDQPGAEDGKELDLEAELTPELQEQIDKALANADD